MAFSFASIRLQFAARNRGLGSGERKTAAASAAAATDHSLTWRYYSTRAGARLGKLLAAVRQFPIMRRIRESRRNRKLEYCCSSMSFTYASRKVSEEGQLSG